MSGINVFPLDAVSGAPSYTGEMLRQTLGVLAAKNTSRPLGAQTGVLPGSATSGLVTCPTSTSYQVNPLCAILDLETSASAGPYLVAINTPQTGTVNSANATYPRIDLIELQLSDPAEGDGTSTPEAALVYKPGSAAASPVAPTPDPRSLGLATIYVPAAGGGSPSVTWIAPYTTAAGGIVPASSSASYPANPYEGLCVYDQALNQLLGWNGTAWTGVGRQQRWKVGRTGTSDNFPNSTMTNIMQVNLPSTAPGGIYQINSFTQISSSSTATGFYRIIDPNGVNLTQDAQQPLTASSRVIMQWSGTISWAGGAGSVSVYVQVSAGTGTVYDPPSWLDVVFVGP